MGRRIMILPYSGFASEARRVFDDFQRTVLNTMVWVAGGDVPEQGVVSQPVTEEQLNQNLDKKKKMIHVALPSEADLNQPPAEPKPFGWPGKGK